MNWKTLFRQQSDGPVIGSTGVTDHAWERALEQYYAPPVSNPPSSLNLYQVMSHDLVVACRQRVRSLATEPRMRVVNSNGVETRRVSDPLDPPGNGLTKSLVLGEVCADLLTFNEAYLFVDPITLAIQYLDPLETRAVRDPIGRRIRGYDLNARYSLKYNSTSDVGVGHIDALPDNIIHLRFSLEHFDPLLARQAGSRTPLEAAIPYLSEDVEWTAYSSHVARERGRTDGIVSPDDAADETGDKGILSKEVVARITNSLIRAFKPGGRGIATMPARVKFQPVTNNSQRQINFPDQHALAETRVPMLFGLHPSLVGTREGSKSTPLSSDSLESAKDWTIESTFIPLWRGLAEQLTLHLLRRVSMSGEYEFDLSMVASLADDENEKADLAIKKMLNGLLTMKGAAEALGEDDEGLSDDRLVPSGYQLLDSLLNPVQSEPDLTNPEDSTMVEPEAEGAQDGT